MSIPYIEFIYIGYFQLENFAIQNVYHRFCGNYYSYYTLNMNPYNISYEFRPIQYPYNYPNFIPISINPQPFFRLSFNHFFNNLAIYRNPESNNLYYLSNETGIITIKPIPHVLPTIPETP